MNPQLGQRESVSSSTPVYDRAQRSNVPVLVVGTPSTTLGAIKSLTPRQRDVLAVMMQGKCNKVIGRILNMAQPTVKNHVTAILKAMNATNRTEAVIKVARASALPISYTFTTSYSAFFPDSFVPVRAVGGEDLGFPVCGDGSQAACKSRP